MKQGMFDQEKKPKNLPQGGFAPRRQYDDAAAAAAAAAAPAAAVPQANSALAVSSSETAVNGELPSGSAVIPANMQPVTRAQKQTNDIMADLVAATGKLAVDDLKLTDANGITMKTPVSILQEILSRRGITPSYELVQIEGAIHQPTFRYRVSFNDKDDPFTAMGAGRSKKEAKHSAARALIDKLTGVPFPDAQNGISVGNSTDSASICTADGISINACGETETLMGNPIGWLQEMCMSRRWPPPTYETETEIGLPHERLFTIACSILNFREVGKGKSKKLAKRLAAHKMWTRLQEQPLDNNIISEALQTEIDSETRNCSNYYGDLKDISVPSLSKLHSNKVSHFHKTLKNATGPKLRSLQTTCLRGPKIHYINLLAEIATENQFEVTYVDIEEKTYSNQYQCLVQLSTMPVGVCHGFGPTSYDAQKVAAQNALEYLKIMTKK